MIFHSHGKFNVQSSLRITELDLATPLGSLTISGKMHNLPASNFTSVKEEVSTRSEVLPNSTIL